MHNHSTIYRNLNRIFLKGGVNIIGIIAAMDLELQYINKNITITYINSYIDLTFHIGYLKDVNIITTVCGIGKVNSAIATQLLIEKYHVNCVILVGIAGGIVSFLKIGDVILSDKVAYYDFMAKKLDEKKGFFQSNQQLRNIFINQTLRKYNINRYSGNMISGDKFVDDKNSLTFPLLLFQPYCVDMEAASVAHVCDRYNKDFISVKGISDFADSKEEAISLKNAVKTSLNSSRILLDCINKISNIY